MSLVPTCEGASETIGSWVLPGEFLFYDFTEDTDGIVTGAMDLVELREMRKNPRRRAENMRYTRADTAMMVEDLRELAKTSQNTGSIVDLSTPNTGRDIDGCKELAKATGIKVISSTGWHLHPPMCGPRAAKGGSYLDELLNDLSGSHKTDPLCGVVTCSPRLAWDSESEQLLKDCLTACERTNAPLNIVLPSGFTGSVELGKLLSQAPSVNVQLFNWMQSGGDTARSWTSLAGIDLVNIVLCLEHWSWDGLSHRGIHPFGHETPSISELVSILSPFKDTSRLALTNLHCMKLCCPEWGGSGRVAALECRPSAWAGFDKSRYSFWTRPSPPVVQVVYWKCDCCAAEMPEVKPDVSFRKLQFRFCSVKCLREHCPIPQDSEKEKPARGARQGGNGMGSWGVSCTR